MSSDAWSRCHYAHLNLIRPRASSLWTRTRTRPEVSQFPPGLRTELEGPDEPGNRFCGA